MFPIVAREEMAPPRGAEGDREIRAGRPPRGAGQEVHAGRAVERHEGNPEVPKPLEECRSRSARDD